MKSSYWSCSKFADWLRGTSKPNAETSKGWSEWNKLAKSKYPFRYWIAEEGLYYLQNFINWPKEQLENIRYYINNRWISKSHALTAHPKDIEPGKWCDVGNRFLPCLFNELVDFVEIETAWHHVLWDNEARKKYQTPWWRINYFRWRTWRCPEAGISHLEWASELTYTNPKGKLVPTRQALAAREILNLYYWWKEEYPNRPDPHEASGWSEFCNRARKENNSVFAVLETDNPEHQKESTRILKICKKIEDAQIKEDTQMLIRLIKIRNSLWT
jgi:hypothetical protein